MRKVLGVFFCLVLLLAGNTILFAQTQTVELPDFTSWPVKISTMTVDNINGKQVPGVTDTYYDNVETRQANNIVLDIRVEDRHAVLWYTITDRSGDMLTILSRFYVEKTTLVLMMKEPTTSSINDFYKYLKEVTEAPNRGH